MFLEDGSRKLKMRVPSFFFYQNYKKELTLPDAEIQYKDAIVETLQQLINNSPDYKDRSVNYEELFHNYSVYQAILETQMAIVKNYRF